MNQTYAPIQPYNLLKSCMIIFLIQALVYIFVIPVLEDVTVRLIILSLNITISVLLGWRLYHRIYHMVFTYDDRSFTLKKGRKEEEKHEWREFSKVSLVRTEEGHLSIRLYYDKEFFDLPASRLRAKPFDLRLEVMKLVSASKGKK